MNEPTPGPWHYDPWGGEIRGGDGLGLLDARHHIARQVATNAAVLCAAPDLLAVCVELAEKSGWWIENDVAAFDERLTAAIAKARGKME